MSLFAQKSNVEEIYQECVYNSLNDHGTELKKYTKQFESHLIEYNVLKDSTAKSYFELFKSIGGSEWKKYKYNYSYIDTINKIAGYRKININKPCAKELRTHIDFEKSKFFKMRQVFLEKDHESVEAVLKKMSEFLEESDFELDFYKYRTLFYLEDLKGFDID